MSDHATHDTTNGPCGCLLPRVARDEDRRQQELTEAAIAWHVHFTPPGGLFDDSLEARVARNAIRRKAEARLHRAVEALLGD